MATRVTTPFGREATAAQVLEGVDLDGRRAIVTGASSGIGVETARALAAAGADVTLAVRNTDAGSKIAEDIRASGARGPVSVTRLELTDRASVIEVVEGWSGPLHILVNNAGVMAIQDLTRTPEGWEQHFAANHLGHLALALGLHDALAAAGNARVVAVSSDAHAHSGAPIDFDDLNFERRDYNGHLAYAQAKVANILFAIEAARRWAPHGIAVNALHPGGIRTGLQKHMDAVLPEETRQQLLQAWPWRTAEQGAATTVLLAASPLVRGVTGKYFENCNEAVLYDPEHPAPEQDAPGVAALAIDPSAAAKLWDLSVDMLRAANWPVRP